MPANWEDETGFNAVPDGNSPFFDSAFITNGDTVPLNAAAANPIGVLNLGGETAFEAGVFDSGGLTIGSGGSLMVVDNGGSTPGNVNIGRVPSFGAPAGSTAADAQAGTLTITGDGTLSVDNRLFLERRNNVNPTLVLTDSASLAVGGDSDIRGTARIVGPNVNYSTDTLQFGGLLRLIPEITQVGGAAAHSPISVTGAATLNANSTVAPEFTSAPIGGERYTLVDAASILDNGVVLDDSQVPLGAGQAARLFVDRSGATEKLTLAIDNALTLTANRRTGALSIGNVHGNAIDIKGYSIGSASGKLSVGAWQSFDDSGADGGAWEEANPTANALNELNLTGSHTFAGGSTTGFGSPYGLSELGETDDLGFSYQTASGETIAGLVEYTGGFNTLVLRVDPATGDAVLTNESQFSAEINGYSITSGDGAGGSGSLLTTFDSLDKQGVTGWNESNTSSEALNELNLTESLVLNTGQSVFLDGLWDTGGQQDLALRFALLGGVGTIDGVVLYEAAPTGLPGDYNDDGVVDAVDYAVWRDNLGGDASALNGNGTGEATVVDADLDLWRANYGASADAGSVVGAVPEPSALALLVAFGSAAVARPHRASRRYEE